MRIPHATLPALRTLAVLLFVALCASIFSFLWLNAGGKLPLISQAGYRVDVLVPDVDNLVYQSDVRTAGVDVGKVENVQVTGSDALVTLDLGPDVAPLHEGAVVTVRNKTLIEETYLEITDGTGPEIPDGTRLPDGSGRASVQLDDVLTSLDEPTREALGTTVRSSALATEESRDEIGAALQGLGDLGREGGDALDALAAQSAALTEVAANAADLLTALDTGQGRVAELVADSEALTEVVVENRAELETVMRTLPPVLDTTREASLSLQELGDSLAPVARNLRTAAPDLSAALVELPGTSAELRGLLPPLDAALGRAEPTLNRVPGFGAELRPLFPTLQVNLADVNPMLGYLRPYGPDLGAFFANYGNQLTGGPHGDGNISRVMPLMNEKSPNSAVDSQTGALEKYNPYPEPGASADPQRRFHGEYPRVGEGPPPR